MMLIIYPMTHDYGKNLKKHPGDIGECPGYITMVVMLYNNNSIHN